MNKPDRKISQDGVTADDESPFAEAVKIELRDSIDLHHFQLKDIPSVVDEYLAQCRQANLSEVRLIHGKGIGVQRNIIRSLLSKHPAVLSYRDAPMESGSWGATIVILRKSH